jgi:phage/plasmid primase-like uncharacterized protein
MIGAATVWPSCDVVAVHRSFITSDGRKAAVEPHRMMLGPIEGGAVRLAPAGPALVLAEGIETALSVQEATGMPTWAALSAGNLVSVRLPDFPLATEVIIAADHDANGAGQRAAEEAAARFAAEGRRVRIALPPRTGLDFNDVILQHDNLESAAA